MTTAVDRDDLVPPRHPGFGNRRHVGGAVGLIALVVSLAGHAAVGALFLNRNAEIIGVGAAISVEVVFVDGNGERPRNSDSRLGETDGSESAMPVVQQASPDRATEVLPSDPPPIAEPLSHLGDQDSPQPATEMITTREAATTRDSVLTPTPILEDPMPENAVVPLPPIELEVSQSETSHLVAVTSVSRKAQGSIPVPPRKPQRSVLPDLNKPQPDYETIILPARPEFPIVYQDQEFETLEFASTTDSPTDFNTQTANSARENPTGRPEINSGQNAGPSADGTSSSGTDKGATPKIGNPKPRYPLQALKRKLEGRVVLLVEVLESGEVGKVLVTETSGHRILDATAIEAVKRWHFKPAVRLGIPIADRLKIPVAFKIAG